MGGLRVCGSLRKHLAKEYYAEQWAQSIRDSHPDTPARATAIDTHWKVCARHTGISSEAGHVWGHSCSSVSVIPDSQELIVAGCRVGMYSK